jgi:hypothetical protein
MTGNDKWHTELYINKCKYYLNINLSLDFAIKFVCSSV